MSATGPTLYIGQTIPGTKYRIVQCLGAGGMGIVYQVEKPPNIGGVLKLMSTELTRHEEHRVRFFDEVRILAQLDHPNIVKVFDYDALPDGTPFYVMELLTGRTVRDVGAAMGKIPPRVAYEVTRQLLEALQCAHTHRIPVIHRDIKPENIFLHAPRHGEPVVKLIDFGVSAVGDRTHDGAFVGTWSYAAPEQIRGEKPTPATDLYAVGLVLYEMLAGVGPFDHYEDWTQISEAQLNEIPAPVSKFAPWVPASIVALIAGALAKDPKVRPRDAYAFAERLFELEWATGGEDPNDLTTEGPSSDAAMARVNAYRAGMDAGVGVGGGPGAGGAGAEGALAHARPGVDAKLVVGGTGPLSRVLSTMSGAVKPSSKNMAAASPATDRLGDVPLIGVPPESVRAGPTWQGVGGGRHEMTSPDADALLEGLGATARKPPSKRERESGPDVARAGLAGGAGEAGATGGAGAATADPAASPRAGQVVIRAGRLASSPHDHGPTTPRAAPVANNTAATMDEVLPTSASGAMVSGASGHGPGGAMVSGASGGANAMVSGVNGAKGGGAPVVAIAAVPAVAGARDTFSSQSSDARRRAIPRSRVGIFAVAGVLLAIGLVAATVVVVRGGDRSGAVGTSSPTPTTTAPSNTAAQAGTATVDPAATNANANATTNANANATTIANATGSPSPTTLSHGAGAPPTATNTAAAKIDPRGAAHPPGVRPSSSPTHAPTGPASGASTAAPKGSGDFVRVF